MLQNWAHDVALMASRDRVDDGPLDDVLLRGVLGGSGTASDEAVSDGLSTKRQ